MKLLCVIIYIYAYQFVHVEYLYNYFHYLGYRLEGLTVEKTSLAVIFLLIPLLFEKKVKGSTLDVIFVILYLLLYIPILVTFCNHYRSFDDFLLNSFSIVVGFSLIFHIATFGVNSTLRRSRPASLGLPHELKTDVPKSFETSISVLSLTITLFLLFIFRHSFSLVSFSEVYTHRSNLVIPSAALGYLIMWSTYLISPITMVIGFLNKKKLVILIGTIGSFVVYGINASKIVLFIPILIYAFYFLKRNRYDLLKSLCVIFSSVMIILVTVSEKLFMLSAVILMRTFGISGLLTYQYNEFFKVSEYTFFSHINFINYFTGLYPFGDLSLGMAVSRHFDESSVANSNANFIATDGLASFGPLGVLLICLIFGVFLRFWNISSVHNRELMSFMLIPFGFIVLNVGLFTAMLSGGFIFLLLFNYLKKVKL